jgi:ATPase family AAA domain-containing protein 2
VVELGLPKSMQGNHPESFSLHHSPTSLPTTVGGFNFPHQPTPPFSIKIPSNMQLRNRNSVGSAHSIASGSEYHESNGDMDLDGMHEEDAEGEDEEPEAKKVYGMSMRGRRVTIAKYQESDSEPDPLATAGYDEPKGDPDVVFDDEDAPRSTTRRLRSRPNPVVLSSDEGDSGNGRRYSTRSQSKKPDPPKSSPSRRLRRGPPTTPSRLRRRDSRRPGLRSRRITGDDGDADGYVDVEQPNDSADDSMEDAMPEASSDLILHEDEDADAEGDVEVNGAGEDEVLPSDGKPYALRQRVKVNYAIPPPLDEIPVAPPKPTSSRHGGGRSNWNRSGTRKGPGWSANGAELSRFLGLPGEDSVCDIPFPPSVCTQTT